ncbi:hypothetical protein D9758_001657 [Tetrapyrgos nigripes]|uniref:Fe2OG dioxygenase domain-containing protein n=1 Tax=Tetrapyrgos nigripes TaxID=182062 RepID=A0A8H5GXH8_9AGAR|nr:hypothetical protein D9758_001657 [Tetrapyrgos nigripes]
MSEDTDVLIALVSSQLNRQSDVDTILDALVQSNGDPQAAASLLNEQANPKSKKRKRAVGGGLHGWLDKDKSPKVAKKDDALPSRSTVTDVSSSTKPPSKSSKPASTAKPVVDLMSVLRQPEPTSPKKKKPQISPLTLSSPAMIAEHIPCTLHTSVLPPKLASDLFYTMLTKSKNWQRNKWWLFDKVVESPHRTSFFARKTDGVNNDESWQEVAQYWYNGRPTAPPETFPPEMEAACSIIERVVSDQLCTRKRFPLEWAGGFGVGNEDLVWRANVAASNCYEGRNESVGWHSDQMQYLGPYCTIASLSLGTRRNFSLREVIPTQEAETRRAQTFNIPLPHNSLVIMHGSCQERFKHSIPPQTSMDLYRPAYPPPPSLQSSNSSSASNTGASTSTSPNSTSTTTEPSNCRINITFRFYRPDFKPDTIPKCKCGIPMILRPDMKGTIKRFEEQEQPQSEQKGKGKDKVKELAKDEEDKELGKPVEDKVQGEEVEDRKGERETPAYTYVKRTDKYWWTCYAGAQNDGKGCTTWKVMDFDGEGRGPAVCQVEGAKCIE